MRIRAAIVMMSALLLLSSTLGASGGPLGFFGIIEKVVFEPDEARAERIQIWGAFGYINCCGGVSKVARGYVYFRVPAEDGVSDPVLKATLVRREWADLKAVAGTGQAIGFSVPLPMRTSVLTPVSERTGSSYLVEFAPANSATADYRVRPASEPPVSPAEYRTDTGIVRLSPDGTRASLVKQLQEALRQ